MIVSKSEINFSELLARESALRADGASLRMRDAAHELNVPEGALIEARRLTGASTRLRAGADPEGFGNVIARLGETGEVMALTRNEHCVHEKHGVFAEPKFYGAMGQVVGEIDLRLFMQHWRFGYALTEVVKSGTRRSLQFFDATGTAVHKVYATAATRMDAFEEIIRDFTDTDAPSPEYEEPPPAEVEAPDDTVDVTRLLDEWAQLEHSHDFYGLVKRHGITRHQAMRLATPHFVQSLDSSAMRSALKGVAERGIPVMIFVGNRGCIQIHSGPLERIEIMGPWLNVLDPRFNLHLREDRIATARRVHMPSTRGGVHSIELFDTQGHSFCQMFGERKPGRGERDDWREFITSL